MYLSPNQISKKYGITGNTIKNICLQHLKREEDYIIERTLHQRKIKIKESSIKKLIDFYIKYHSFKQSKKFCEIMKEENKQ